MKIDAKWLEAEYKRLLELTGGRDMPLTGDPTPWNENQLRDLFMKINKEIFNDELNCDLIHFYSSLEKILHRLPHCPVNSFDWDEAFADKPLPTWDKIGGFFDQDAKIIFVKMHYSYNRMYDSMLHEMIHYKTHDLSHGIIFSQEANRISDIINLPHIEVNSEIAWGYPQLLRPKKYYE